MTGLILAAAGVGARFGSTTPKQFRDLEGSPVFLHSLLRCLPFCRQAVVLVPEEFQSTISDQISRLTLPCPVRVAVGGIDRQQSVQIGLGLLEVEIDLVLVHDAARPFVSSSLITRVIETAAIEGACVPVIRIGETVKEVSDAGKIVKTLDRDSLRLAQTPQAFDRNLLARAFDTANADQFTGTDEACLVERLGVSVCTIPGERTNLKITWASDLPTAPPEVES